MMSTFSSIHVLEQTFHSFKFKVQEILTKRLCLNVNLNKCLTKNRKTPKKTFHNLTGISDFIFTYFNLQFIEIR